MDYMTALEYGRKHGRSKQWVIKLCRDGRVDGAYLAGGVWAIPSDSALPKRLAPGPKMRLDSTRAVRIVERDQRRVVQTAARIGQSLLTRDEVKAQAIATLTPQQQHAFKRQEQGCTRTQTAWECDGNWVGPVWLDELSREQFNTRIDEFHAASERIDSSDPDAKWPDWMAFANVE